MPATHAPEQYTRRVLLMATGMTPQVVTETIYALAVVGSPAFVPTELHLISTRDSIAHARNMLLAGGRDELGNLQREYGLPAIHCDENCLHVIADTAGRQLTDIQTPQDNIAAANAIVRVVNELTQRPDVAIHASIAGGRKTLGFYLGYAMSLLGRPQDRMSHVLVNAPFESNSEFFYPPKEPRVIVLGNRSASTGDARVMLADIPFVRLRHGFKPQELEALVEFEAAVNALQEAFPLPAVHIAVAQRRLTCGGREVALQPNLFAFYLWLCRMRRAGREIVVVNKTIDATEFLVALRDVGRDPLNVECDEAEERYRREGGMSDEEFRSKRAKIERALGRTLRSAAAAEPYAVQRLGPRGESRYALRLPAEAITISG